MTHLPSLPTELICRILSYLEPTTELHKDGVPDEQRWDIRHWGRAVAAVARTCRILNAIATPLLYSRYEAAFHNPVIPFIDHLPVGNLRHRGVRHIAIRSDGTTNDKYAPTPERLSQYRTWAQDSGLGSFVLSETKALTSKDVGQIELWRLISQAPNLESLINTDYSCTGSKEVDCNHDQPPFWLSPIVSAAEGVQANPQYNGWFQKLHTLSICMCGQCGTWLVPLLSLPCLKTLSLGCWGIQPYADWEASLVWPEPTASSSVRDLKIWNASVPADVIVRIADYCKALESFKCYRAWDRRNGADVRGRQWGVEILTGLQRHSQTLTSLALDPSDRDHPAHLNKEYARLQGFEAMVALRSLVVPWHVLMGSPASVNDGQGNWEPVGNFRYPNMRSILPKNLRHLKTDKTERSSPGCAGIEQAWSSLLPSPDTERDVLLRSIEFDCSGVHYNKPLPMNLWGVQNAFQEAGATFMYKLRLDPEDFCKTGQTTIVMVTDIKQGGSPTEVPRAICRNLLKRWLARGQREYKWPCVPRLLGFLGRL